MRWSLNKIVDEVYEEIRQELTHNMVRVEADSERIIAFLALMLEKETGISDYNHVKKAVRMELLS